VAGDQEPEARVTRDRFVVYQRATIRSEASSAVN
jgi:hypothetical protein